MTIFEAYKLYKNANRIQGGIMPVKKGFSTSEFTMALIGAVIPILNSYLGWAIPIEAVLSISAIVISYITSRTVVKRNGGTKTELPPTQ